MSPARLHLVDGTFELYRAHFAKRPSATAPDGQDVKGTVGVMSSLLALLEEASEQVTHLAVAFDNPIRSFRNDLFAGYKSDDGVPPEIRNQFDLVEEGVAALGIAVWSMRDFEADDAIASGAARFAGEVEQVRILSPDKDFGQCLVEKRVVQVDRMRNRTVDEFEFTSARGIAPKSLPDWLALVGDTADRIPGIRGIGETSASALLRAYGHLEKIPARARDWSVRLRGAEAMAERLVEEAEKARLYRTLATLRLDAPIAPSLEALEFRGVPRERYRAMAERLGSSSLAKRELRWA